MRTSLVTRINQSEASGKVGRDALANRNAQKQDRVANQIVRLALPATALQGPHILPANKIAKACIQLPNAEAYISMDM